MTRPRGTVPVRLSRWRAAALASLIRGIEISEPTILGCAGMSETEVAEWMLQRRSALDDLGKALSATPRGRPRAAVSIYYLPRTGIAEMRANLTVGRTPRTQQPMVRQIVAAARRRKGPSPYRGDALARHIANGGQDARNLRRLKRRLEHERWLADRSAMGTVKPISPAAMTLLYATIRF